MEFLFQLIFHFPLCVYYSISRLLEVRDGAEGHYNFSGTVFVLIYSTKCGASLNPVRKFTFAHKIVILLHTFRHIMTEILIV